uniref:Integrase catalytic domain-containing protein n=1 Tax=Pundamilia nyererei TaxID=303518 RepID=A0A3B4F4P9_9CICH
MDFLALESDTSGTRDILVLTDHFTKFAVAIPTPNQKARTVAKCLWENYIIYYGIPERIHTDQGQDFESRLIKELCEFAGIQKSRTTPYHPRGNPVERFNRTLLAMLGTLETKQKTRWKEHVKPLVHAYNCTRNEVTGFTPYELMFSRTPRLPVDLAFNLPLRESQQKSHSQYIKSLKSRLEESFSIASSNATKAADRNKKRFDNRVIPSALEPGDRVLVMNVRLRVKHKLSDKWEEEVYVVVHRAGDLPVYKVKPENSDGPMRTLHRDLLLPCGLLTGSEVNLESPEQSLPHRPRTRQQNPDLNSFTEPLVEDEDTGSFFSLYGNPPTLHFTVEKQNHFPDSSDGGSLGPLILDPSVEVEVQGEPASVSSVLPPAVESGGGQSDSDVEDILLELVESHPENRNSLPGNLPGNGDILVNIPVVAVEDSPEESSVIAQDTDIGDGLRRSQRQRAPPDRLHYFTRGNPLISVVQTMLHSLSDALGHNASRPSSVHVV